MFSSAAIFFVIGLLLGSRFKALALVPVCFYAGMIGYFGGGTWGQSLLWASLMPIVTQLGYLMSCFFGISFTRRAELARSV